MEHHIDLILAIAARAGRSPRNHIRRWCRREEGGAARSTIHNFAALFICFFPSPGFSAAAKGPPRPNRSDAVRATCSGASCTVGYTATPHTPRRLRSSTSILYTFVQRHDMLFDNVHPDFFESHSRLYSVPRDSSPGINPTRNSCTICIA